MKDQRGNCKKDCPLLLCVVVPAGLFNSNFFFCVPFHN